MNVAEPFQRALVGMTVSHAWRGGGSAIFFEFGQLVSTRHRNGVPGEPKGEFSLMLEWSWRIERPRSILIGSFSPERKWAASLKRMVGARVIGMDFVGYLPEVVISMSNGLRIASFMTAEGQPVWAVIANRSKLGSLYVRGGRLNVEAS